MQRRILITGASGELGAAIARHYADPGTTLLLWGRDEAQLEAIAVACRANGANAGWRSLDLVDAAAAVAALVEEDRAGPIDIVMLAAGLGDIMPRGESVEDPARIVRLGSVNFLAPCAMAAAIADRMMARGRGHIVLIGSAAAFHPLPFAAAYAASKAGLARFAEALRIGVAPYGVRILLASPGPIDTHAGRAVPAPAWMTMQSADVAARIARASAAGAAHLVLPWPFALLRVFDRLLPTRWRDRLLLSLRP